jgi:hypothetical protein
MKRHNPSWGCPRVAHRIALAFRVDIDKDVVRRVLRFVELRSVSIRISNMEDTAGLFFYLLKRVPRIGISLLQTLKGKSVTIVVTNSVLAMWLLLVRLSSSY